ncbi:hypothetical protein [Palleronia rufa]|uniref:hypothetical protein n=1 Tax=Palleronia rufa TaxID=1530186 RepID=UPI001268EA68|nr:hypothetical protein [Palleronia rufa]
MTFEGRWTALPPSQKLVARQGRDKAATRRTRSAPRDKTTIAALDWVSPDGRTQDRWAHDGDGKAYRPTMLVRVDVASDLVPGWTLARSENAGRDNPVDPARKIARCAADDRDGSAAAVAALDRADAAGHCPRCARRRL